MHPERWKKIKEVLDIALRLDPAERGAYLTRACEDDTEMRQEIESLLEAHEASGEWLEKPALQEPADAVIGARLGAYEVVELIGHGGMGSVYRGVRIDEAYQKEVAIKVVKRGLDLDRVVRQFRRERQIAASLEHPNIATLIDGGTTAEGLPYFVMEFIRGKPIDVYCDEMGLKTRSRLELFATVCAAVQFAHNFGVVHRDIKPGNLLVTKSGVPKLLDFGVAKILNPDVLSGSQESIGTFAGAMTPDYASPEQISGGLVTEASDVYSLGVLLYELLTGERPKRRLDDGRIREPLPPSKTKGGRGLHRDLDDIVLMAMHPEPEKRYPSAADFEADIHRYLDSRPVRARKGRLHYRAAKLLSRNRSAVAIVGMVVALAAAGAVTWQVRSRTLGSAQTQIVPVTSLPGSENQPYFSPDGKKIVYVWSGENGDNPDLYIQSLDDGSVRRFTTDPADDLSPVWSPDGTRIAWLRTGRNETAVFVANVAGGMHSKVADVYPIRVEAVGRDLDWSPDGEYLAVPDQIAARGAVPYRADTGQGWSPDHCDHAARQDHRGPEPGLLSRRKIARIPACRLERRGRRVRRPGARRSGDAPHVRQPECGSRSRGLPTAARSYSPRTGAAIPSCGACAPRAANPSASPASRKTPPIRPSRATAVWPTLRSLWTPTSGASRRNRSSRPSR